MAREETTNKKGLAPEFVVLDEGVKFVSVSLVDWPLDPAWKIIHVSEPPPIIPQPSNE